MKKFIVQFVFLIIITGVALVFFTPTGGGKNFEIPFLPQKATLHSLEIGGNKLKVEVADTQSRRSKGLGGRQSLPQGQGMLFIFDHLDKYPFWMKGLSFPLDFIWIKGSEVVDILPDVPPPVSGMPDSSLPIYQPRVEVDKVLEVNAQTVGKSGIKIGDKIKIQ